MPKGQKIVDWTKPENDQKLLLAIIKANDITGAKYADVAAAFGEPICQENKTWSLTVCIGGGVPASCIGLRISKLRALAKEGKTTPGGGPKAKTTGGGLMSGLKPAKGKPTPETETSGDRYGANKANFHAFTTTQWIVLTRIGSDDKSSDGEQNVTPPKTPKSNGNKIISGRVTKRISPRKNPTKDYKKLVDPFMEMDEAKDEEGGNIFGKPDKSEDEDSDPSDTEFGPKKEFTTEQDEAI